jgi:BirA family biotin operon repressor/biotin-[acetyl-CoA-carboxylase] ligase
MWGGNWDIYWFAEIDSTNTYLSDQARSGASEGTVVVANHQTAGRGRLDRRWEAPPGASLLMSVLFRPDIAAAELYLGTAAVALAAVRACRDVAGVEATVKWPNDVMVGGRKLAGVLAEAEFDQGAVQWVVIGMGINVAWPGPDGVGGTCLDLERASANANEGEAPSPVDRDALLDAVLSSLSPRRTQLDSAEGRRHLAAELRAYCSTLGSQVRVELAAGDITGLAEAIDDDGHLIVQTQADRRTVTAGDVVHLRPA